MKKERKDKSFLDKPYYEGGNKALRAFVDKHLVYPDSVLEDGIEGTVVIKYSINHKGEVVAAKVVSGIGHGCDEAAQQVVQKLQFQVGNYRNIKVTFHKTIRIHFRAETAKKKAIKKVAPSAQRKQASRSISYSITPSKEKAAAKSGQKKSGEGYSYTINIGK